jgi:hypothetical protein
MYKPLIILEEAEWSEGQSIAFDEFEELIEELRKFGHYKIPKTAMPHPAQVIPENKSEGSLLDSN